MQGRIGLLLAGAALAVGGGVAGAVVVAPGLQSSPSSIEVRQAAAEAEKEAQASLQHTFEVAKKARGMARGARGVANSLVDQVNVLSTQTQQALNGANNANSRLDASQAVSNTAAAQVTTNSTSFVSLQGGPQVTVTVPQSGLIDVYVSATFGENGNVGVAADGVIALFEDGQKITITEDDPVFGLCAVPGLEGGLLLSAAGSGEEQILATPPALGPLGCGVQSNSPSPVQLSRPPGTHTYELRYGDCGCEPEPAAISNRVLRVVPHP